MDPIEPEFEPPEDVPAVSAEALVDGELAEDLSAPQEARRYPSTVGGLFYLIVLGISIGGLVLVAAGSWRLGIQVLGAALLFAAGVRVALSSADAGMLGVRHKAVDVTLLVTAGVLLIVLARTIPNQPG